MRATPSSRTSCWAAMPSASVKVGKASWSSASCSTRRLAAMATAATWMTSAEYSPKDVRAQQVALAPFHDQLAEALSVAVDHGPEQVVIADDRDGAVVALARLGLRATRRWRIRDR
jgi:hypothetical protein